jgi:hypothetical protein
VITVYSSWSQTPLPGGVGGQLNDFSVCCLTIVIRRGAYIEDENKEVGTAFKLSH